MWRQGDVLIQSVEEIPDGVKRLKRPIVASGDSTGHSHKIKDKRTAQLYAGPSWVAGERELFLEVTADEASLVHPEHDPIVLEKGQYRIWRQREYSEYGDRVLLD